MILVSLRHGSTLDRVNNHTGGDSSEEYNSTIHESERTKVWLSKYGATTNWHRFIGVVDVRLGGANKVHRDQQVCAKSYFWIPDAYMILLHSGLRPSVCQPRGRQRTPSHAFKPVILEYFNSLTRARRSAPLGSHENFYRNRPLSLYPGRSSRLHQQLDSPSALC